MSREYRRGPEEEPIPPECERFFSDDPYVVLGIDPSATENEVRKAARKLQFEWHPDRNNSRQELATKVLQKINGALSDILKDKAGTRHASERSSSHESWRETGHHDSTRGSSREGTGSAHDTRNRSWEDEFRDSTTGEWSADRIRNALLTYLKKSPFDNRFSALIIRLRQANFDVSEILHSEELHTAAKIQLLNELNRSPGGHLLPAMLRKLKSIGIDITRIIKSEECYNIAKEHLLDELKRSPGGHRLPAMLSRLMSVGIDVTRIIKSEECYNIAREHLLDELKRSPGGSRHKVLMRKFRSYGIKVD